MAEVTSLVVIVKVVVLGVRAAAVVKVPPVADSVEAVANAEAAELVVNVAAVAVAASVAAAVPVANSHFKGTGSLSPNQN